MLTFFNAKTDNVENDMNVRQTKHYENVHHILQALGTLGNIVLLPMYTEVNREERNETHRMKQTYCTNHHYLWPVIMAEMKHFNVIVEFTLYYTANAQKIP